MLSTLEIKRADVLWLRLPQSLAPIGVAERQPEKTRPFIVLNGGLSLKVDHNNACQQDRSIFGMDCTSKPYLVAGRPHFKFRMPGEEGDTYALTDSVRDISSYDKRIKIGYHLGQDEENALIKNLDNVLKPEQKFFLKATFNDNSPCLPGQIWRVKSINADGEALVLLRRGRFVSSSNVEDSNDVDPYTQKMRHTPYLVAYFKRATGVKTLRGLKWDDIQIMALQEQSFVRKLAELTPQTSGILMNNIRARVGLPPIEHKPMLFRNVFNPLPLLRLMRF